MEEKHSWHFYLVDDHSEVEPVVKCPENLVLIQNQGWIQRVVEFQSVLNESLSVLDKYPQLFGCSESRLLEPPWQEPDIPVLRHEILEILRVDCLHAPQF